MMITRACQLCCRVTWVLLVVACSGTSRQSSGAERPADAMSDRDGVTLERGRCRGGCTPYRVTLQDDGRVVFALLDAKTQRVDSVDPVAVSTLLDAMRSGGFNALDTAYVHGAGSCGDYAMDAPVGVLTLRGAGRTHSVRYDHGCAALPRALFRWSMAADSIARTQRWLPSSTGVSR